MGDPRYVRYALAVLRSAAADRESPTMVLGRLVSKRPRAIRSERHRGAGPETHVVILGPPRVTVLMAVHNGARYLRDVIDGVLGQEYRDFEFFIINDGSTDRTAEILGSVRDDRVCIHHQERAGLTVSLCRGLEQARGAYVARQDADDIPRRDRLGKQVAFLDCHAGVI